MCNMPFYFCGASISRFRLMYRILERNSSHAYKHSKATSQGIEGTGALSVIYNLMATRTDIVYYDRITDKFYVYVTYNGYFQNCNAKIELLNTNRNFQQRQG
jgi:hypothetical protein